jgi:hypothetical protein
LVAVRECEADLVRIRAPEHRGIFSAEKVQGRAF